LSRGKNRVRVHAAVATVVLMHCRTEGEQGSGGDRGRLPAGEVVA
jgi:hypothetical protein